MQLEAMILAVGGREIEVVLRKGTSDTSLVGQIFVDHAFDLGRLRRIDQIRKFVANTKCLNLQPLIVDAGANIGLTSIYLSVQCPDAMIVAVEPDPGNYSVLRHNVKELPVVTLPCALACEAKRLELFDPGEGDWGFQTRAERDGLAGTLVNGIGMGDIYQAFDGRAVPFIAKIDIEGGEDDVFSQNLDWIDDTPIIIVELHDWMLPQQRTSKNFLKAIAGRDRDFVHFGENIFSISNDLDGHLARYAGGRLS